MTQVQRLESCPDKSCTPQARNDLSCYGKNGTTRACMLAGGCRLLSFKGDNAWAGPADFIAKQAAEVKAERKANATGL